MTTVCNDPQTVQACARKKTFHSERQVLFCAIQVNIIGEMMNFLNPLWLVKMENKKRNPFGDGNASKIIVKILKENL
jgi:UDP-N-acetylglucosamine 2-epimerase